MWFGNIGWVFLFPIYFNFYVFIYLQQVHVILLEKSILLLNSSFMCCCLHQNNFNEWVQNSGDHAVNQLSLLVICADAYICPLVSGWLGFKRMYPSPFSYLKSFVWSKKLLFQLKQLCIMQGLCWVKGNNKTIAFQYNFSVFCSFRYLCQVNRIFAFLIIIF